MSEETVLRRLFDISAHCQDGFDGQIQAMLSVGIERFALELGLLARVRAGVLELTHVRGPGDAGLSPGQRLDLSGAAGSPCLAPGRALGTTDPATASEACRRLHERWGLAASLGVAIGRGSEVDAVLMFADRRPRHAPFPEADVGILDLMADWFAGELWRHEQEHRLQVAVENFRLGLEAATAGMLIVDGDGRIAYANTQALEMFGHTSDTLIGEPVERLVPDVHRKAHAAQRATFTRHRETRTMGHGRDLEAQRRDGSRFPVEIGLTTIDTSEGVRVMATIVDLTERVRFEEQIIHQTERLERINAALAEQAISDALTGLVNRRGLQAQMDAILRLARRQQQPTSLLMVDVDHFKTFNDTFGHAAGDEALRAVAGALRATARASDLVARYGGEEFVILLPETDRDGAHDLAERLRAHVADLSGLPRPMTISIGVATAAGKAAVADAHGQPPFPGADEVQAIGDRLIRQADQALYAAKTAGRDRVVAFGLG